jgi:three-Cys-motif partner protein
MVDMASQTPSPQESEQTYKVRITGRWGREKLHLLNCYAPAFVKACKRADGGCFIDAFAGPGWNVDESGDRFPGSPQIACALGFRNVVLIDTEKKNTDSLRALDLDKNATIQTGDANILLPQILSSMPRWLPVLAFLDQDSNQVEWSTLEALADHSRDRRRKPELLILLPTGMALARLFREDGPVIHPHVLTKVFGAEEVWRPLEEKRKAGELRRGRLIEALAERYASQLQTKLGYEQQPLWRHVKATGETGRILYTLVFVTDHQVGRRIMEGCFEKRYSGQESLF